VGMVETGNELD